jgi:ribosome production factor 2
MFAFPGRTYDHQILDMVEFGVENFKGLDDFKNPKVAQGCKPCLLFSGEPFLSPSSEMFRIKNLLIDFFHGEEIINIRLEGIEHVISFVALDNKIYMRSYRIILLKSGEKAPYAELEEIGPCADLILRRSKLASADLFKSACKKPKEMKVRDP